MTADIQQRMSFPVEKVATSLRPDIVLWSPGTRQTVLLELTVAWKERMNEPSCVQVFIPDTSSVKPKLALKSKNKPTSTRRRNAKRFVQWMTPKRPLFPLLHNIKATVDYSSQTEARDTVVGKELTPTKYRGEPVGVIINTDIVTGSYNPKKACHRLYYYTSATERSKRSRIDFDEGFDIDAHHRIRQPSK
ncbi:unnamed protein product [Mytilus coruscus]|uniref:Uncharacterized protein n=1 Tax=Mytilus coruscus TaxID=42192 RepID=A0A6J8DHZ8_MYTCO|nr:unnamed protein product [Mytilus coruscus]